MEEEENYSLDIGPILPIFEHCFDLLNTKHLCKFEPIGSNMCADKNNVDKRRIFTGLFPCGDLPQRKWVIIIP